MIRHLTRARRAFHFKYASTAGKRNGPFLLQSSRQSPTRARVFARDGSRHEPRLRGPFPRARGDGAPVRRRAAAARPPSSTTRRSNSIRSTISRTRELPRRTTTTTPRSARRVAGDWGAPRVGSDRGGGRARPRRAPHRAPRRRPRPRRGRPQLPAQPERPAGRLSRPDPSTFPSGAARARSRTPGPRERPSVSVGVVDLRARADARGAWRARAAPRRQARAPARRRPSRRASASLGFPRAGPRVRPLDARVRPETGANGAEAGRTSPKRGRARRVRDGDAAVRAGVRRPRPRDARHLRRRRREGTAAAEVEGASSWRTSTRGWRGAPRRTRRGG